MSTSRSVDVSKPGLNGRTEVSGTQNGGGGYPKPPVRMNNLSPGTSVVSDSRYLPLRPGWFYETGVVFRLNLGEKDTGCPVATHLIVEGGPEHQTDQGSGGPEERGRDPLSSTSNFERGTVDGKTRTNLPPPLRRGPAGSLEEPYIYLVPV